MKKKHYLLLLLLLLTALGGVAQQYRLNRQKLCLEGGSFARKAPISNENYMYIPNFRLARGETKDVTVYLRNTLPMWLFQLYLQLPEGISVNAVSYDAGLNYWPSDYANPNSLTWGMVDNELRIISMNNSRQFPIPASAAGQAVLTLRVTAAQNMVLGNCIITTSSFKFVAATTQGGEGYIGDNRNCTVDIWQLTTAIGLTKTSTVLYKNEKEQLVATIRPADATYPSIEWTSSNPSVATVDANGLVTARDVGTATITATNRGTVDGTPLTATCVVEVRSYVESIALDKHQVTLDKNASATLVASFIPSNAYNKGVTWTSRNTAVATVTSQGLVRAVALGTTYIVATTQDGTELSDSCLVTVNYFTHSISLNQTSGVLYLNEQLPLAISFYPSDATDKSIEWASNNPSVATVDENGLVTAHAVGTATITATNRGTVDGTPLTATCVVEVRSYVESIALNKHEVTLDKNASATLVASFIPSTAYNKGVTWTSRNTAVATVTSQGLVRARAPGTTYIVATTQDGTKLSDSCQVTVNYFTHSISLNQTSGVLHLNEQLSLAISFNPSDATDKSIEWTSSNPTVATVDENGLVTACAVGTATITATNRGSIDGTPLTATCVVEVRPYVESIILDKHEVTLDKNSSTTLVATLLPDNAYNKVVTWTSRNTAVATVTSQGLVRAVALGTTYIVATTQDGTELSDSCLVTVNYFTHSISLNQTSGVLYLNEQLPLAISFNPSDATDKSIEWTSSNPSVATVDENGLVTAHAVGTATITATNRGTVDGAPLTATCVVEVRSYVESITLNKTETEILVTGSEQLTATVLPANAYVKTVTWSSSNTAVATVNQSGLVTALSLGVATITATTTDGTNLSATCQVTVTGATDIVLNKENTVIYLGENETLTATVLPVEALVKAVVWSTSDPEVATVDNTGMITATGRGTATITATTTDGTNLSATCRVDVHPHYALEIDSLSHIRGAKAETVEVPVRLINKNAISGLQFNITLPAGVTMAMFDGMPDVWLNDDRKARNHSVNVSQLSDNQYLVLVSSPTNRDLKDNDGPVVYMNLELAQYHDAGEYSIVLSDILLNEADETEHLLDDFSQKVKFYYMLGDADADTHVDVADYTAAALTILKLPTIRFYHDAANVNDRDEVINLTDLTGITNIALGNREAEVRLAPARRGQEDESQVHTGSMALTGHYALANSQLTLGLDNGNAVAAMQMDIALPGGATLKDAALTSRAGKHQLSLATLDDGRVRVLVSAFSDAEIAAGEGAVLTLTLEGMTDGEMAVTDILAVERDLTTHSLDDLLLPVVATGIDRMTACDEVRIYTQGTDIIIESPNDGTAQLVMLNGMTRPLPVKAGLNRYPMAEGYYIVRLGGKAVKLRIHNL